VRRQGGNDVLNGAVLVDVARHAECAELAHLFGVCDGAAEDHDRRPKPLDAAKRADDRDALRLGQTKVEHHEVDWLFLAGAEQQFGTGAHGGDDVPRRLERHPETVADERGVVGDEHRLHGDCRLTGHHTRRHDTLHIGLTGSYP
jgi:hypothetical protein